MKKQEQKCKEMLEKYKTTSLMVQLNWFDEEMIKEIKKTYKPGQQIKVTKFLKNTTAFADENAYDGIMLTIQFVDNSGYIFARNSESEMIVVRPEADEFNLI